MAGLFSNQLSVCTNSFSVKDISVFSYFLSELSFCLSKVENIARGHRVSPLRKSSASVSLDVFSKREFSTQTSCFLNVWSANPPQSQLQKAEVCRNSENFLLHGKVFRLPTLFTTGTAFRFSEHRADMNSSAYPYYK